MLINYKYGLATSNRDCAFAQSDQNLHWAHFGFIAKEAKFLHANNEDSDQIAQMCGLF